jgi:hypothetical protein
MAGIVGTIWAGVALRRLKAGADPDSPPRAVALPTPWEDEAGEALAALAPGSGPATLPTAAEAWIQRLTLRGRRLGLLDGADAAESLAAGLRALILARRGAPGGEIWRDARGEGRFVLNLPAFLDGAGGFDAPAYRAACQLAVQTLDIWGHGKVESLRLGIADSTGRQLPEKIEESSFDLPCDLAIQALGFDPEDVPTMFGAPELAVTRWGTLKVNHRTMMTAIDGVFAAGDVCTFPYVKTGEELRVEHWDVAIQQGRVAARNMLGKKIPFNDKIKLSVTLTFLCNLWSSVT